LLGRHPASGGNGLTEVQVIDSPLAVHGQGPRHQSEEAGWENTLTGIPQESSSSGGDYLKPRGYRIGYQIIDYSGGVPGDIAITFPWFQVTRPVAYLNLSEVMAISPGTPPSSR